MARRRLLVPHPLDSSLCLIALLTLLTPAERAGAREHDRPETLQRFDAARDGSGDRIIGPTLGGLRADTLGFGGVGEDGFAILDGVWTWDDGGPDPLEGWYATDVTQQSRAYFRRITAAVWTDGDGGGPTGNEVPAPVLAGAGSLWLGAFENEADTLCWEDGLGYGNAWCQRAFSPVLVYAGTGSVTLSMTYFNDTEPFWDYSRVLLRTLPSGEEISLNGAGFTDRIGLSTDHPALPPVGAAFQTTLAPSDFGGETEFEIVFEMTSDGGWSDEDGDFTTEYGPFGADDVTLSGAVEGGAVVYGFEDDLEGWVVEYCPGAGLFAGVRAFASYMVEDPCECGLSGNVLEFHDDFLEHPSGEHVQARSNPVDVLNDVTPFLNGGSFSSMQISCEWDQYSSLPRANGVFYRAGWDYYPYVCPLTGNVQWSGRVGQGVFFSAGEVFPLCHEDRNVGTDFGVPANGVEQIRFVYELYSSCDAFAIPPDVCTHVTNFTPIVDNFQIRFADVTNAPAIGFHAGTRYQDGFPQDLFLDPSRPGRADVTINRNFGNEPPYILGDSLCVLGPFSSSSTRWESRLWFRLAREGPGTKPAKYVPWRNAISDGRAIVGPNADFTYAWMDSFQIGTQVARNKFVSYLRETGEDDFGWDGGTELSDRNEIIRDDILVPGTRIEYFVSSNYTATPMENFLLSDTTGGSFLEFEILPGWRLEGDHFRFPCVLYIDAYNEGVEPYVEHALDALGLEFDRYDYLDPGSNWKAPLFRDPWDGSNNGATLFQLLGYRAIVVTTGDLGTAMWPEDYTLLSDWLEAHTCDGNVLRQGLLLNGDNLGSIMTANASAFLFNQLGSRLISESYRERTGDENYCVRLEEPLVGGEEYGTRHSLGDYDLDAWGNGCPDRHGFDVIAASPSGVGNRAYTKVGEPEAAHFAQVVRDETGSGGGSNFRTVLDGVSYHHLSDRQPDLECVASGASIETAVDNEMRAAFEWIFGPDPAGALGSCLDRCTTLTDIHELPLEGAAPAVTHLFASRPNPFNPRTAIRFSLAADGRADLMIFDAQGRRVRVLHEGPTTAGLHEVVWDGTDDDGRTLPSGVYWSQLRSEGYRSNRKLVLLQ